jgi:hypothetical protein
MKFPPVSGGRLHSGWRRFADAARNFALPMIAEARRVLMAAGVPLRKEFLVLCCMKEGYGLFTEFTFVLAGLQHFEASRGLYAGIQVEFLGQGYYYDRRAGENWWEYFFEPVALGSRDNARIRELDNTDFLFFVREDADLNRNLGAALIRRHIRVKTHVRDSVDVFVRDRFDDAFVVGVHYRGTDKVEEAPRVPYAQAIAAVGDAVRQAGGRPWKLFVATDEQAFLDYARRSYPDRVICQDAIRSIDGQSLHVRLAGDYRNGEGAVLDCLLLSRCDYLIRTESELSLCSTLFNPDLPVRVLRPADAAPMAGQNGSTTGVPFT